jgi:hypothetical protein
MRSAKRCGGWALTVKMISRDGSLLIG